MIQNNHVQHNFHIPSVELKPARMIRRRASPSDFCIFLTSGLASSRPTRLCVDESLPIVELKPAPMFSSLWKWRLEPKLEINLEPKPRAQFSWLCSLPLSIGLSGRLSFREALRWHMWFVYNMSLFISHLCQNVTNFLANHQPILGAGVPAGGGFPGGQQVGFQPRHHCAAPASAPGLTWTAFCQRRKDHWA